MTLSINQTFVIAVLIILNCYYIRPILSLILLLSQYLSK